MIELPNDNNNNTEIDKGEKLETANPEKMATMVKSKSIQNNTTILAVYLDPFEATPESYKPKSVWKSLVENLMDLGRIAPSSLQTRKSSVKLTERNLTEFFNPDYRPEIDLEHHEWHQSQTKKRDHVSAWIEALP